MFCGGCRLIRGGNRFFVVVTALSVVVSVVVVEFSVVVTAFSVVVVGFLAFRSFYKRLSSTKDYYEYLCKNNCVFLGTARFILLCAIFILRFSVFSRIFILRFSGLYVIIK